MKSDVAVMSFQSSTRSAGRAMAPAEAGKASSADTAG